MEVILLEKVRNLGDIGDKVSVKAGHARNHLVPYGKAVIATAANLEKFTKMREELEKNAVANLKIAEDRAAKLNGAIITIPAKASEEGKLFGSIGIGSIVEAFKAAGYEVKKSEITLPQGPIRHTGEVEVTVLLHSDISVNVKVSVVPAE